MLYSEEKESEVLGDEVGEREVVCKVQIQPQAFEEGLVKN